MELDILQGELERNSKTEEDFRFSLGNLEKRGRQEEGDDRILLKTDLDKYKGISRKLGEEVARLEADFVVACESEQAAQQKIADLELWGRRYEEEIQMYKMRCTKLEAQVLELKQDKSSSHDKINLDEASSCDEKAREGTGKYLMGAKKSITTPMQIDRKKLSYEKVMEDSESGGSSPARGSSSCFQGTGDTPPINGSFKFLGNIKPEKTDVVLITGEGFQSRIRQCLSFKEEETSDQNMDLSVMVDAKPVLEDVVLISDSDDEKGIGLLKYDTSCVGTPQISKYNFEETSDRCKGTPKHLIFEKVHFDQKIEDPAEVNTSSFEENFLFPCTPKRRRKLKVVTSDTEGEEDEDHKVGRLPLKPETNTFEEKGRLREPAEFPVNESHVATGVSSSGHIVEESLTPSRRRLHRSIKRRETKLKNGISTNCPIGKCRVSRAENQIFAEEDGIRVESDSGSESSSGFKSPRGSSKKCSSATLIASLGSDAIEESKTPSKRRLLPFRKCRKTNPWGNKTSTNHSSRKSQPSSSVNAILSGTTYELAERMASGIVKDDVVEVESEGESLGGFIVKSSNVSPEKRSCATPSASSCSDDVEESLGHSKNCYVPLRQGKKEKDRVKRNFATRSAEHHRVFETVDMVSGTSRTSRRTLEKICSGIAGEDEKEGGETETESESLSGFIVERSSCSASEHSADAFGDEVDSDSGLNEILDKLRRHKDSSNWVDEGHMLSSLGKNPQLCMKAVCALYRRQTSEEQSVKGTIYHNRRGFNTIDAPRGSELAEFLSDGDPCGPVTKSVEEVEMRYPGGAELCRKLAFRYSRQLFEIYESGEDPRFHP